MFFLKKTAHLFEYSKQQKLHNLMKIQPLRANKDFFHSDNHIEVGGDLIKLRGPHIQTFEAFLRRASNT